MQFEAVVFLSDVGFCLKKFPYFKYKNGYFSAFVSFHGLLVFTQTTAYSLVILILNRLKTCHLYKQVRPGVSFE